MMPTPQEVCRWQHDEAAKVHLEHGRQDRVTEACVDAKRNQPEERAAKGLNPTFTGCPGCHRRSMGGWTEVQIRRQMRDFMESAIYNGSAKAAAGRS